MNKHSKQGQQRKQEGNGEQQEKVTIGLDLGDKWTYYCVLHGKAEILDRGRVRTRKSELEKLLRQYAEAEVGMETGTHCGWVSRTVRDCGHEAVVGHAKELKKRYSGDNKNDWKDAESIARILRLDRTLFHAVQLRSAEEQADLSVIRGRAALVEARSQLVSTVRSLAKNFGTPLPKCSTPAFVRRVAELIPEALRAATGPLLDVIQQLSEAIRQSDKGVQYLAQKRYPETRSFQQVSGVSDLTALTYRLTLWDRDRFRSSRDVGVYLGLTPRQEESGQMKREKGISKAGNRYLRKLLVQSAHYILGPFGPDSALRRFGQRLIQAGGGTKRAKKRAAVAVARKLAVVLHKLWYGEVYEPLHRVEAAVTA